MARGRPLILYADAHVLAIDKPSGLAVHRGWDNARVNALTIARELAGRYVYPAHRLDRGTSGVLVFGLDAESAGALGRTFAAGEVHKRYLALARGVVPEHTRIDHPIPRVPKGERVEAITEVRRLEVLRDRYSWIEAVPETGRLHQIRRHLKHLSHPLMGDTRYGDGRENRKLREAVGLHRLALHAAELRLVHPITGVELVITAPLPDDLRGPLERLRLAAE